jgi:hypothetical protein
MFWSSPSASHRGRTKKDAGHPASFFCAARSALQIIFPLLIYGAIMFNYF